jgi:hypothetical protein
MEGIGESGARLEVTVLRGVETTDLLQVGAGRQLVNIVSDTERET